MTDEIIEVEELEAVATEEAVAEATEEAVAEATEEAVAETTPEYPKSTDWADFEEVNGKIKVAKLNKDYTEFDIAHSNYFNGDDEYSAPEYKALYFAVARACNDNNHEYTIDCFNNRYTVRKVADIESIHYEAMSDEEKAEYDKKKFKNGLLTEKAELKAELESMDYIGVKIATGRATVDEYADKIERMKTLATRINDIDSQLEAL